MSINKSLLVETIDFKPLKNEGNISPTGHTIMTGVLATCEVKNGNGRYYSRDLWEREIDGYQQIIKENRASGELDHPDSQVINLKNVSHKIIKCWWDGDDVMGNIKILHDTPTTKGTPSGNILQALIENEVLCGVSSRGMGSLEERGDILEVQDDFELLCWDFVSTPSNPGSYMNLVKEGKNPSSPIEYGKINSIVREILCSQGQCPID